MTKARYKTEFTLYPYRRVADQNAAVAVRHPVVIVGGGAIGMVLALDLAKKNIPCVVLDDHDGVGAGSRAICFSKRTLEICDRLGCGQAIVDKGVIWNVGRVFRGAREIYDFDLLPEQGHRRPAFVNLQQPYFERFVVDTLRAAEQDGAPVDIRGQNQVNGIALFDDYVALDIATPEGDYQIEADWLIACDGANSAVRNYMNLEFQGEVFKDNFLIADIRMKADFPTERRFWFDPPFNPGQTALLHKQPDDVWRLDFQLGWGIDRAAELAPDRVRQRVMGMIGNDTEFELVWTSIYTFQCCSMERYRNGRVIFAGDSAHQVSPFGARGCNGGVQDADNLAWKLAMVIAEDAPEALLDSYDHERHIGAKENILNSTRTATFLTPRNRADALFRDAVLDLSETQPFARAMVNSGRLSLPCVYDGSPLNSADALPGGPQGSRPGAPCPDAPVDDGFLLDHLGGRFELLFINEEAPQNVALPVITRTASPGDPLAERYLGTAKGAVYLLRPDQHVAARWAAFDAVAIETAFKRASGMSMNDE
ncbi:MAG: FAD-dependent oxidoreductase [Pseudomonadota bacterium]